MKPETTKRLPSWRFGICMKPGKINCMHKTGKPYYYPVSHDD